MNQSSKNQLFAILVIFVFVLAIFFRFYRITEIPLGLYPDEAMNGSNALEAIETGAFKLFYPENNGREGLFINIQAISVWYFGNTPWALRGVSAFFGTLTVLGVFLLAKELFRKNSQFPVTNFQSSSNGSTAKRLEIGELKHSLKIENWGIENYKLIPLLSSFLVATSFWHINFSRIGFRAILVPFLSAFGMYFLLKGFRRETILDFVWAGIFIGLGFHTYIAFRTMPLVIALPILWYGWKWFRARNTELGIKNYKQEENRNSQFAIRNSKYCVPCAVVLFLFMTFVVALPIGYYFLNHPEDFMGRTGQVSVFAADSPAYEFVKSNAATIGMFFIRGDCNARHNLPCRPELNPIAGFFFAIGILSSLGVLWKTRLRSFPHLMLLWWAAVMTLPAALTKEGLPHALRAIGMIPPVFILAGYGGYAFACFVLGLLEKARTKFPEVENQIMRISREFSLLFLLVPLFIPVMTYEEYFLRWISKPDTYFAFATDLYHIGLYLDSLPNETKKYVIVNMSGVEVRGIPMPAQTVMYTTDTFTEAKRRERNTTYLLPDEIDSIQKSAERIVIVPLNGNDNGLRERIDKKFPDFRKSAPGDFVVYQNY